MTKMLMGLAACLTAASVPSMAQPGSGNAGGPTVIQPDDQAELQWAAAVMQMNSLRRQGDTTVKLFGTAGGDPAMNGLQTYIAFYVDVGEGFRIFRVGDFLTYSVAAESPGSVTLALRENVYNEATGEIGDRTRRITISWTIPAGQDAPTSIRVSPAR